ncbi:type 4a pilus biogenesis protein PilO [Gorillibacterium sp. sgz5001074]|uniref:type 4a pilus biogenesis protein PilO n=1 Tax=Gorillibacterium sp. sgz5001074 TaxID=3446695 RepID=UPI003F672654
MSILSNRKNLLFISIVLLLIPVVLYLNFLSPVLKERDSQRSTLNQKKHELASLQQQMTQSREATPPEAVKLAQLRRAIPEEPNVEGLIRDMRMLETVSGVKFEVGYSFDTASAQSDPNAPKTGQSADKSVLLASPIQINQTVKGDYKQIYRLLEEIQSTQRLIQVDKVTFNTTISPPVKLNAAKQELNSSLSMTAYYASGLKRYFKNPIPIDASAVEGRSNPIY